MRVFTSEDEEYKFIQGDDDDFVASYAYGEWFDRKMVDPKSLKELDENEDIFEVSSILRQARKALKHVWMY
ncbi:MAG: hypothetical protein K2X27_09415 [Candidatus Obscuribacterales bacterium]|nr:hypothetical protein [Candidatus Obscuribacterales bacterium]